MRNSINERAEAMVDGSELVSDVYDAADASDSGGGKDNGSVDVATEMAKLSRRFLVVMYGGKQMVYDHQKNKFFLPGEWAKFEECPKIPVKNGKSVGYVAKRK